LAAELSTRLNPPENAAPTVTVTRSEPAAARPSATPVIPSSIPEPATPAQNDHNLAEMAQQLEAALRRAPLPESRPPVTDPLAASLAKAPPARDYKPRIEPKFEPKPKIETKTESAAESKAESKFEPAAAGKSAYDNLEEEMASLLGRPPGKT
jgi:hypothetical protein